MRFKALSSGPLKTNSYALLAGHRGPVALIDVPPDSVEEWRCLFEAWGIWPSAIWLTHSHWDHIADLVPLLKLSPAFPPPTVAIHALDGGNLRIPGSDQIPAPIAIAGYEPNATLDDKEVLRLGELTFQVLHTPGHSPGGVCLYCESEGLLFSGDTLFCGGAGTTALPTAEPRALARSLRRLAALPAQTRVLPGHGPATTIGAEVEWMRKKGASSGDRST